MTQLEATRARVLCGLLSDRVREAEERVQEAGEALAWARDEHDRALAELVVRRLELQRWGGR